MLILYYGIMILLALGLLVGYYCLKKKNKSIARYIKIIVGVLIFAFVFRFMWGDDRLSEIYELKSTFLDSKFLNMLSLIFNWFIYSSVLILCMYPFYKTKQTNTLVKYFCLPVSIISIILFNWLALGLDGSEAMTGWNFRMILFSVEIAIAFAVSLIVFLENGYFKSEKSDLKALYYLPLLLLATMPPYMLKGLFGYFDYALKIKELTLPHRLILYASILIPIFLYFLLRKKDGKTIKAMLLYISLGTLLSFSVNYKFYSFLDVTHWPFHLCNTAMYIIPICLMFKWDKLFYFTYFINVLGAFLAMIMPNYSTGANLFSDGILVFYINHFIAFFMPILMVALRCYDRPKLKQFKYSMIGFGIYFLLVLILNAWFSNYGSVDYFFVNSDFVAEKLGKWAEDLRNVVWSFNIAGLNFTFYPLYQAVFFIVYVGLGAGVWFIYEGFYSFVDTLYDISERKKKIKLESLALEVALAGRKKEEPINKDGENKLILRNFSKRYGKSEVYAVKDANLEIHGGEIFGFLGHNGAGKSTIIKSIVGIQPITSGSIEVCGYDVDKQSVMAKKNIGFVPDHYALYEKLTGREYINYIADLYDVSLEDRNKAIEKYVKLFELNEAFDNQMKTYSHGMKQKIAIMSALVHNPKVWILDEPLTGLDPNSIYQVKECMKQHAKAGNIVFFSSHLIDIVEQLCDKIAIIKKGKILTCEKVSDIEKECSLEEYYLKITSTRVQASHVKELTENKESAKV